MHVLIAGAGLGGPALALALARQGIRSTIYEIRERQSNAGGSITLTAGAIKVLDNSIGVYDKLKSAGYTYTRMGAHSEDGYRYGDVIVGDEKEGYPALRIMRSKLNEILLQQCQKLDGLVDVKWGAVTKAIREDDNGVKVQFENGSSVEGEFASILRVQSADSQEIFS
jgi:2-polyprenyl-6-methoxyphenol hydroxylase-like FAD-dependent oxidoreductase